MIGNSCVSQRTLRAAVRRAYAFVVCGAVAGAAWAQPQVVAIRGAALVGPDGELQESALIVIRDGVIAQVGGKPPSGAPVIDFPGGVICPGLIDVNAALGAERILGGRSQSQLTETASALTPEASAAAAFDRYSSQLAAALDAGVTTFALAPDDGNVVGGRVAVARTNGKDGRPALLTEAGPVKLSLSSDTYMMDREPTSRSGAVEMLRSALRAARGGGADDPLAGVLQGKLGAIVATPEAADVDAFLRIQSELGFKATLIHDRDAADVAAAVAGAESTIIVGPLDFTTPPRSLEAAVTFERAGATVVIAGGLPARSADSLRLGAALAVRYGMSPPAARRAITIEAARVLGVEKTVGSLANGRRADFVVFSADPLDLRARVLAVFVDGRRVSTAPLPPDFE